MEGNGKNFNDQVEATAFAGEIRNELSGLRKDVQTLNKTVESLKPFAWLLGAVPTVVAALALAKSFGLL